MDREKVIRIIDELIFEAQKAPTWKAENALRCLKKELLKEQEAKQYNSHEVACIIADLFGDFVSSIKLHRAYTNFRTHCCIGLVIISITM